jgi:hypothetical protein
MLTLPPNFRQFYRVLWLPSEQQRHRLVIIHRKDARGYTRNSVLQISQNLPQILQHPIRLDQSGATNEKQQGQKKTPNDPPSLAGGSPAKKSYPEGTASKAPSTKR